MSITRQVTRIGAAAVVVWGLVACASGSPQTTTARVPEAPSGGRPASPVPSAEVERLPEFFESDEFVVVFARTGDTPATLAARFLGDAAKAWMIEEYAAARTGAPIGAFTDGQEVVIPKREWNHSGVTSTGYQLVPILVYHNLAPQAKGRLVLAVSSFEQQMRYLKTEGYRVISIKEFLAYAGQRRQLPRRSVVLAFDDGYRSFRQYAVPILKEHGFTATIFVYTDYIGAGRNALSWQDLRELSAEGFDVHAHSKTHGDLRRAAGENDAQYARRMQAELGLPQNLLRQHLGRPSEALAYPYGWWDEHLLRHVTEHGYVAAFTVRRQANPSFVSPLRIHRSQVYAEMTLEDFVRNLNVFHQEDLR